MKEQFGLFTQLVSLKECYLHDMFDLFLHVEELLFVLSSSRGII